MPSLSPQGEDGSRCFLRWPAPRAGSVHRTESPQMSWQSARERQARSWSVYCALPLPLLCRPCQALSEPGSAGSRWVMQGKSPFWSLGSSVHKTRSPSNDVKRLLFEQELYLHSVSSVLLDDWGPERLTGLSGLGLSAPFPTVTAGTGRPRHWLLTPTDARTPPSPSALGGSDGDTGNADPGLVQVPGLTRDRGRVENTPGLSLLLSTP